MPGISKSDIECTTLDNGVKVCYHKPSNMGINCDADQTDDECKAKLLKGLEETYGNNGQK